MEKQKLLFQFKSSRLWKDSISLGFAIFGVVSAIFGVLGITLSSVFKNTGKVIFATIFIVILSYLIAVISKWWNVKSSITLRIRGIKVTVCQGDIFKEDGWKVIGVDDTFSTSEDDMIIAHSSLHGKLLKHLRDSGEIEAFEAAIDKDKRKHQLGNVKTYKDYILLVWTHLNKDNEAHIDSLNYENILRKMWTEIGRVYSGKPIVLPIIGDGITRFNRISEKPSSFYLLKCMLCTLRTSNVQINAPIKIVIYNRINEINLYNLEKISSY